MSEPLFQFKLQALPTTLTRKKRIRHRFFPLNFAKFLRKPFTEGNQEAASTYTKINYMNEI